MGTNDQGFLSIDIVFTLGFLISPELTLPLIGFGFGFNIDFSSSFKDCSNNPFVEELYISPSHKHFLSFFFPDLLPHYILTLMFHESRILGKN
jgi:hypothetical protein